jgi:hypothetical protein
MTKRILTIAIALLQTILIQAQLKQYVGSDDFSDWTGIRSVKKKVATFESGKAVSFTYTNHQREYPTFLHYSNNVADWGIYSGLSFEVYLKNSGTAEATIALKIDPNDAGELNAVSSARLQIAGQGWQKVYVPWTLLDVPEGQRWATLQAIKTLEIALTSSENKTLQLKNVQITKGEYISLHSNIRGISAKSGSTVTYELEVGNTTNQLQGVRFSLLKQGWETMQTSITPDMLELKPGEIKKCQVSVFIPSNLPQGIREKQIIRAIPSGQGSSAVNIEYQTAVQVPFPNITFTAEGWQKVLEKADKYDWAKKGYDEYVDFAENWKVPEGANFFDKDGAVTKTAIFHKTDGDKIFNCAIAYQLTGNEAYAAKCIKMLRRLVSMENGYPVNHRAGWDNYVGEGGFYQGFARAYDLIRNSPQLTDEDKRLTEHTFRLYIDYAINNSLRGAISNWDVAEITGALYCALNLQDWNLIEHFLSSPTGIYNQIAHGVMSDGWWYECAVGYNLWVASEFSQVALALEPWGINLKDKKFPIGTSAYFSLMANRRESGFMGMAFEKWGTINSNSIGIKDMWDAVVPFLDYRGVLPAVNDAQESLVTGGPYELAYYLYQDPEYAAVINRGDKRDLLYGVPDLPAVTSQKMKESAYADNLGLVQLRSQTPGREQREQIQAALHYGSHGGFHGHFDRTNFLSMMRYGRSFYNPEMFWYGYRSYLYKMLVQTSINKNMVVVDEKQQEPKESFKTFFYTGDMLQATAVETNTRWSYPPYAGTGASENSVEKFAKNMWDEGRTIDLPDIQSFPGGCTDYTDSVLQRRLMIVMDDYVVLADYLKAEQAHQFDWLMQIKGFKGIVADKKEFIRHDNQMSTDPLGSAQFIVDCDWYKTEGTSRASFEMCWGDGCDNRAARMPNSEDGPLKMDVFNAWPIQNEIMIGAAPESFAVNKQLWYTILADNQELVNDSTGAWILGSKLIKVDIAGKKQLVLKTNTPGSGSDKSIFWGNAKLVLKDGSEVYLSSLPVEYKNVAMPEIKGLDYEKGPVKIQGELLERSIPGNPENLKQEAVITVDLSGLGAVSFEAKLGSDFPLGDETQRRKTMAVRSQGKETRYLSVVEPYETESVIKSVTAKSANELVVELLDGRVQHITITGLDGDGKNIQVSTKEFVNGELVREEKTN